MKWSGGRPVRPADSAMAQGRIRDCSGRMSVTLARYRPTTVAERLAVPGIGEAKAQRYLPAFLDVQQGWR
jgi:hypothetical protein